MASHSTQTAWALTRRVSLVAASGPRSRFTNREYASVTPIALLVAGPGSIAGQVKVGSVPVAGYRVGLYDRVSGQKIAETVSGVDGAYGFTGFSLDRTFDLIAWDATLTYNAVIADNVRAAR